MRFPLKLFVLGVAFALMTCSVGADEACFKPDGRDIKLDSACTKGEVIFERKEQSFSVEFSAPDFRDTNGKRFKLTVGGCNVDGSVRWDSLEKKTEFRFGVPSLPSPSVTLTAKPNKLNVDYGSSSSSNPISCSINFESKDGNKYVSSLSVDLSDVGANSLRIVIKDAVLISSTSTGLSWWAVMLIVAGVALVIGGGIGGAGWCLYRRSKQSKAKAKAKADVEAQSKGLTPKKDTPKDKMPDAVKPKKDEPKDEKFDDDKPEKDKPKTDKPDGNDKKKPAADGKVDAEAVESVPKKDEEQPKSKKKEDKPEPDNKAKPKPDNEAKPKLDDEAKSMQVESTQVESKQQEVAKSTDKDEGQPAKDKDGGSVATAVLPKREVPKYLEPKPYKKRSKRSRRSGSTRKKTSRRHRPSKQSSAGSVERASLSNATEPERHRFEDLAVLAATSKQDICHEIDANQITEANIAAFEKLFDEQSAVLDKMAKDMSPEDEARMQSQGDLVYKLRFLSGNLKTPGFSNEPLL